MPKKRVTDLITDQEIAFALLILAGTMTDRQAAQAVGLNPETAAYTKAKPRVRAYMLEHRAAVREQLVEQEAEGLRRRNLCREQVLARLWVIANLSPEMTRNSASAQVKALSMIIAIEGLIPERRAIAAQNEPARPPASPPFYVAEWMRDQQHGEIPDPQPAPTQEAHAEPLSAPSPAAGPPPVSSPALDPTPKPTLDLTQPSFFPGPMKPSQTTSSLPRVPMADYFSPDTRVPYSVKMNPFGRRR